jgi:hypothetical protein
MKGMIGLFGTFRDMSALTVILSPFAGTWIFWYPMLDSVCFRGLTIRRTGGATDDTLGLGKVPHSCSFSTESHALFDIY